MPDFIPLTMLKDTIGIVEFCQDCGEPVFVTRNGIPEMVIMDSEFFNIHLRYRTEDGRLDIKLEYARIPKTIVIKELKNTGELTPLHTVVPPVAATCGDGLCGNMQRNGRARQHYPKWV